MYVQFVGYLLLFDVCNVFSYHNPQVCQIVYKEGNSIDVIKPISFDVKHKGPFCIKAEYEDPAVKPSDLGKNFHYCTFCKTIDVKWYFFILYT